MRAFELASLGLRSSSPLRFEPETEGRLLLPFFLPAESQEAALQFLQRALGPTPRRRIEIEWYRELFATESRFLTAWLDRHGAERSLLVVRVRGHDASFARVLSDPTIHRFEHVVIAAEQPMKDERLGLLSELCGLVRRALDEEYETLSDELTLSRDAPYSVAALLNGLLDPLRIVEVYNALVDVQIAEVAVGDQRSAVLRRSLRKLFEGLEFEEQVVVHCALRDDARVDDALAPAAKRRATDRLEARWLWRDGALVGWAAALRESELSRVTEDALVDHRRCGEQRAAVVRALIEDGEHGPESFEARLRAGERAVAEGRARVAREIVDELWLAIGEADGAQNARLLLLEAQLNIAEGRFEEATSLVQRVDAAFDKTGQTKLIRARALNAEAVKLAQEGELPKAERLLREARALLANAQDSSGLQSTVVHNFARAILDQGRAAEAEQLFREALELLGRDNASATLRGVMIHDLARGVLKQGRADEAASAFGEALTLKLRGNDSAESVGVTTVFLARALMAAGRATDAEALIREALPGLELGGEATKRLALALIELLDQLHAQ
jgi:tetratricopeptide (TPR) repeat protein